MGSHTLKTNDPLLYLNSSEIIGGLCSLVWVSISMHQFHMNESLMKSE
jgi:hypothetical protein